MPGIGPIEVLVVLIIALLVFGPKRLPEMGRSAGRGMREFKESITAGEDDHGSGAAKPSVGEAAQPPARPIPSKRR